MPQTNRITDTRDVTDTSTDETAWISGLFTRLSNKQDDSAVGSRTASEDPEEASRSKMVQAARRATQEYLLSESASDKCTFGDDSDIDFNVVFTDNESIESTLRNTIKSASESKSTRLDSRILKLEAQITGLEGNVLQLESALVAERIVKDRIEFERDVAIAEAQEYKQQLHKTQVNTAITR